MSRFNSRCGDVMLFQQVTFRADDEAADVLSLPSAVLDGLYLNCVWGCLAVCRDGFEQPLPSLPLNKSLQLGTLPPVAGSV